MSKYLEIKTAVVAKITDASLLQNGLFRGYLKTVIPWNDMQPEVSWSNIKKIQAIIWQSDYKRNSHAGRIKHKRVKT